MVLHQLTAGDRTVDFKNFLALIEKTVPADLKVQVVLDCKSTHQTRPSKAAAPSPAFRVSPGRRVAGSAGQRLDMCAVEVFVDACDAPAGDLDYQTGRDLQFQPVRSGPS